MAYRTGSFDSCVEEILEEVDSGKTFQVMDNLSEANSQKNGGIMDIKELKANHPELVQAIENETLQTVESETSSLKEKIKTVEEENSSLKKSLVVKEKELSEKKASELFSASFDSSKIPAKFESKVFKDTELASFIDENGKLNEEGYKESVAKAVASWEEDFKDILVDKPEKEDKEENTDSFEDKEDKKILGTGTAEEEQSGADDDLIERMVKFATK